MTDKKNEETAIDSVAELASVLRADIEDRKAARDEDKADRIRAWKLAVDAVTPTRSEDLKTPVTDVKTEVSVGKNALEQRGFTRADAEIAAMIIEGSRQMQHPVEMNVSEDFTNFYNSKVRAANDIKVVNDNGKFVRNLNDHTRASDSSEAGFGLELIGAQYATELWQAARNQDTLVDTIRVIDMTAPTSTVPVQGDIPALKLLAESTTQNATAYTTTKVATAKSTLTAKKLGINSIWSGELDFDSVIAYTPYLREQFAAATAYGLGSAIYNGDLTNAGTGHINEDDADPADTNVELAFDGIRHDWLVTTAAQGKDMAGALDVAELLKARGKLTGGGLTPNWGRDAKSLVLVADFDTYLNLVNNGDVITVDKYGPSATILTGELAKFQGVAIVAPAYAKLSEADGKQSTTSSNNTKGQITVFAPAAYLQGRRADVSFYFSRIQRTDQFLAEIYMRVAFTRFGTKGAAGIFNITV